MSSILVEKSIRAALVNRIKDIVVGGGVAANSYFREKFFREVRSNGLRVHFPARNLCIDNAAMVAGLGYWLYKKGKKSNLSLDVK